MNRWLSLLCLCLVAGASPSAFAQPLEEIGPPGPLVVGVAERPPFASKDDDGTWQGLAVNLWRTSAEEMGRTYRFEEAGENALLEGVADGRFDVALPVYASPDRPAGVDFVFPFHMATLGIAERRTNAVVETVLNLLSWQFLRIILYLSALLLAVGALIWLIERRGNEEEFNRSPVRGLGSGFWWAGVTLTTIGYGDKAPKSFPGRAVAMLWMLVGLAVSASLTAAVVSASELSTGGSGLSGLKGEKVAVVEGSRAASFLATMEIEPKAYQDAEQAMNALQDGEVDQFVHAAPALLHRVKSGGLNLRVTTSMAEPVPVTFAVQEGSGLARDLETIVLERTTTSGWWSHVDRWIPETNNGP